MRQENEGKAESEENFYQKIANPYEIKSYHKPQPVVMGEEMPARVPREPERQQREARPSDMSREISSANKASRVFQSAPAMDYYAEQEEKVRVHREMLKQTLEVQMNQDMNRKRREREQKEMEDKYWEERAKKQLAEMNSAYEREKENEAKLRAKAALGSQLAVNQSQKPQSDAIDKLKHEIFDKQPNEKSDVEKSVSKKATISYDQLQKMFREQHQKRDRSRERGSDQGESFKENVDRRNNRASLSPNKSAAEDELNQDPDLENSRQRDFSAELAKFRQIRKEKLKKEGPVQKPYDYYLNLHKKRYELGNPENTKVYNPKTVFLTGLEDPQPASKQQSTKSLTAKQSQQRLTPAPVTQAAASFKVLPPSATVEDRRLLDLQQKAFAQVDDFKDLNRNLKADKLKGELRQDFLKKTKLKEPVKLPAAGPRSKTYGVHGMFVPSVDWLADHESQQEARQKYNSILVIAQKGEHKAQELRRDIERYKNSMSFQVGQGLEDPQVQLIQEEAQDKHLKQVVKEIEDLLASR